MSSVTVKPVSRSDSDELIRLNQKSVSLHHPWVHPFTDRAGFDAYFQGLDNERKVGLVARNFPSGAVIGVLNLSEIVKGVLQSAYLGFYGVSGKGGRGLMTHALRFTLAYAFEELGLHRVEANIQPGNERSLALVKRVGFRKEGYSPRYLSIGGEWRDHERWAILTDEFVI